MGKTYHEITSLVDLQNSGILICNVCRIAIFQHICNTLVHNRSDICKQTNDTYLLSGFLKYNIWLHQILKRCSRKGIVGTHDRNIKILNTSGQLIYAIVEFVVAQTGDIKAHGIENIDLYITGKLSKI